MPHPADHKTPGQFIKALLEERGWTQNVLASVLGIHIPTISQIVAGKRDIDAELALALADVFNVPAESFMDLQKSYELSRARLLSLPNPALTRRAALFGALPVVEMIKRRWIDATDIKDVDRIEAAVARFFGVKPGDEIPVLPHAAKKSEVAGQATPAQLAWLCRVRQIAREMIPVGTFSVQAARGATAKLSALLSAPEEARHVPRILSEAGIRYVIVESLPSAKIDGVTTWLNPTAPVIGISLRYDRIDNFWFVLRHELEHVVLRHGMDSAMLDVDLDGDHAGTGPEIPQEERDANEAAAAFCVPRKDLESFIARKQPFFTQRDILGFSAKRHLHPGSVAGQLRHRLKRWDLFAKHLVKIRHAVAPGAMVDGWGDVAPIQDRGESR